MPPSLTDTILLAKHMEGIAETPEAMEQMGRQAALHVPIGTVIALVGELGAGKTHWTKGFVAGIGSTSEVTSPTFALVHEYKGGRLPIYHFDFYRLHSAAELIALGWDDYLESGGIVITEWGNRFPDLLPKGTQIIHFQILENAARRLSTSQI